MSHWLVCISNIYPLHLTFLGMEAHSLSTTDSLSLSLGMVGIQVSRPTWKIQSRTWNSNPVAENTRGTDFHRPATQFLS